jgi:phage replication O-like protein O
MSKTIVKPLSGQGYYTVFNNALLDFVMPQVGYAEWKVLCFVVRKTIGWQKESDKLSYSQIMQGTGIKNRTTVSNACKGLVKRGLLIAIHDKKVLDELDKNGDPKVINQTTNYIVNRAFEIEVDTKTLKGKANNNDDKGSTEGVLPSTEGVPGGSTEGVLEGSTEGVPGVVQKVYQQNKDSKTIHETKEKSHDKPNGSSSLSLDSLDYDSLPTISHYEIEFCPVYARLEDGGGYQKCHVVKSTSKRIRLQPGEEKADLTDRDPEKVQAIYANGEYKRVVLGEKQDKLTEKEKVILSDLKDTFQISSSATESAKTRFYSEIKSFAINIAKHYGKDAIKVWVSWYENECSDQAGEMSGKLNYCQKTLDIAVGWYKAIMADD